MNFTYGGRKSEDYGVIIGHTGGMENIPLIANTNLIYDQTPNKYYHYGVTKDLLEFNWNIVPIKGHWEDGQLDRVVQWLNQDDFTKFTRDSWPGKVLYIKPTSMTLGGLSTYSSYIDVTFTNISPYYYSESSTNLFTSRAMIPNDGIDSLVAIIKIESNGGLIEITDGRDTIVINDTIVGDIITIDNTNGIIQSKLDNDILSKYNGNVLELSDKENNLEVNNGHKVNLTFQSKYDTIE